MTKHQKAQKHPTIYCQKHPDERLNILKYQVVSGKPTRNGNPGTAWVITDWRICRKCDLPCKVELKIKIHQVRTGGR